jgi:selenide,water dikinase
MGGRPFLALNIAALPPQLPTDILGEILRGGAEIARQAGVVIAGGHTVQDKEPKYGLVVVGFIHPKRILTKGGANPGDRLVLTKPLGFGTTTTAIKRGIASPEEVLEVCNWMKRLNKTASELAVQFELRAATDVTGFSLLGHAYEMAQASATHFRFDYERIPFIGPAEQYGAQYVFPGGASDNLLYFGNFVSFAPHISESQKMLLFDPQTSGGLLLCVPEDKHAAFLEAAERVGQPAWTVGAVLEGSGIEVV